MEGDLLLSLRQTVTDPKIEVVEEEDRAEEVVLEEEEVVEEEEEEEEKKKSPELNITKLFISHSEEVSSDSLYEKLKASGSDLSLLAPAAGDTIISLDFTGPGQNPALCTHLSPLKTPAELYSKVYIQE